MTRRGVIIGLAALAMGLLAVATRAAAPIEASPAIVHVAGGDLRGAPAVVPGIVAYKGIPYAAPPTGERRWRAPQTAAAWTGVRDATRFGDRCLSALRNDREPGPPRSEDCLTLNVWTSGSGAKRPVMAWLHGGGFQFGAGSNPQIDGARLAAKGAVVVTFNYRLGVMGFLAHPDLDREGPSGDYGLQDQLAALRWVKANIAAFGGDPANVTLFGESAGAHALGILMASPLAHGLFAKAIGESGAFWDGKNGPLESFAEAHARGVAFAKRMHAASIADLRALPAEAVNAAAPWDFTMDPMVTVFSPNVDGYVVPAVPAARYVAARQMAVPLLAGWNAAEGYPFDRLGLPHATAAEFRAAASAMFGTDRIAEFQTLYPAATDAEANASAARFAGDIVIAEQTWQWLELQQRRVPGHVWGYRFTHTSPYTPVAAHITEVPFVFGTLTPQFIVGSTAPPGDADRALSNTMMSYWVNFATRGDPNGPGLPPWPAYGSDGALQEFGATVAPTADADADRLRFIASFRRDGVLPARWRAVP